MAQTNSNSAARDPASPSDSHGQLQQSIWRRFFGRDKDNTNNNGGSGSGDASSKGHDSEQLDDEKAGLIRRVSRKVVPGLPRAQTFKRQQSELRDKLEPIKQTPAERRAVSVDRRVHGSSSVFSQSNPRTSAPDFLGRPVSVAPSVPSLPASPPDDMLLDTIGGLNRLARERDTVDDLPHVPDNMSNIDAHSITTSQYDVMIHDELERVWILNLSMHFRDKSKREKFFVTYREHETLWRRVTISLDYRDAPENSLELDLATTKFQRDKSAKIYEAIRESLPDIQFYDTVTNLKLQTTDGRLHVHVVEDGNEVISYPTMRMIDHMGCRRIKESELEFDSHMSGFVYKVRVDNQVLIKKEIPGPDTVDEFLYEINALNRLRRSEHVIQFYGVVVDDNEEHIKGLLISYADRGALIDVIYDNNHELAWETRERWARQIVNGLAEIHEAGFVQGDFTLSNIVIDNRGDAKIIDINRRGCPVGWEPPEATPLIESSQRISMYIGVKSDLYQLGMVLWALATQEDEPEAHGRPLHIGNEISVPLWYRQIVAMCLSEDPRHRRHAFQLASMFPDPRDDSQYGAPNGSTMSVDDRHSHQEYGADSFIANGTGPRIIEPPNDWSYVGWASPQPSTAEDLYYYPTRGRSPPSPMPSNHDECEPSRYRNGLRPWSDNQHSAMSAPSVSDAPPSEYEAVSDANTERSNAPQQVADGPAANPRRVYEERNLSPRTAATPHFTAAKDPGRTEPKSRADSGKDLSDSTPTPQATPADTGSDALETERLRENAEEEKKDVSHEGTTIVGGTPRNREQDEAHAASIGGMIRSSREAETSTPGSRATSTSTPVREVPDDLKGIGSAYDAGLDGRRGSTILEVDFGMGIDTTDSRQHQQHHHHHHPPLASGGVEAPPKTNMEQK